jgi:hypothetical protein
VGGALFVGGLAIDPDVLAASSNSPSVLPTTKFMEVSSLLINHQLNSDVGARLAVAMSRIDPGIEQDIDQILDIARKNNAKIVEDFFPAIPHGKLKDTALAIISAWYMGVLSNTHGSKVYAFELALMYQPTRDVMTIPSYAISGPNGWNSSAPPLADMPNF